jgi:hypothetical protein
MRRFVNAVFAGLVVVAVAVVTLGCGSSDIASHTSNIYMSKDEAMKAGIMAIETGIGAYVATGDAAPPIADEATLGSYVTPWPVNPWTNQPMHPGSDVGDYTYEALGGQGYSLVGHLSDGEYVRP